jgi:hypothetical protein
MKRAGAVGVGFSVKKMRCMAAMAVAAVQLSILALPSGIYAQFSSGGWTYNRTVTVNPTGTTTAVANFPVLVRLNGKTANGGTASDSLVFATAQSSGNDIRFSLTGYTDSLTFEIERFDPTNLYAEFWVMLPVVNISGTATTFKMYFGNAGVSGSPSNPAAIWTNANGFSLVYHMNNGAPGAASGNAIDASTNGLTGTLNGTITQNAGTTASGIGIGETFDGSSGYYSATSGNNAYPAFAYQWTASGWFYLNSANAGPVCSKGDNLTRQHSGNTAIFFSSGTGSQTSGGTCPSAANSYYGLAMYTTTALSTNAWHHVVWQYQGTGATETAENISIDGAPAANQTATMVQNKVEGNCTNFWVGLNNTNPSTYFNGVMDEFRVDSVYRGADWISLCYQTQIPPSVGTSAVSLSSFTLAPAAPILSSPTNNTGSLSATGLSLSWASAAGSAPISSYSVQVSTDGTFASTVFGLGGIAATSQALPTLAGGTLYYWRANASGPTGTSNWTAAWSFSTIAPFAAPPLALPTNGAVNQPTSLNLSWIGVTGAVSYALQVSTASGFGTTVLSQSAITGLSQNVSLANNVTYYWRVNVTGATTSLWSSAWSFSTMIASPALTSPTNGAGVQPTSLNLTWGAVGGATSYGVLVSTGSSFSSTVFGQTGLTSPTVALSGLANGQIYYWTANATNANGTGNWSAAWNFTTVMATAGVPQPTSPTNGNTSVPIPAGLSWQSAVGATTYEVEVATNLSFGAGTTVFDQSGITGTTVSVGNLLGGLTYYWQVRALNNAGPGLWSGMYEFQTAGTAVLHSAPVGLKTDFAVMGNALSYSLVKAGSVEISFSDFLGRTEFVVKRTGVPAGHYSLALRDCDLSAGRYIVHFKAAGLEKHQVVLIEK